MALLSSELSTKSLVPICRQLATAYEAGIPILRSLDLVARHSADPAAKKVLDRMAMDIRAGASLGQAARANSSRLPKFFIELVAAGEHGGRLDVMLKDLADYYEDTLKLKRTVIASLVYPGLQLTAAWFLGSFALRIIGMIGKSIDEILRDYLQFQAFWLSIFAGVVAVCFVLARLGIFRWIVGAFSNFVWPFKNVTKKFALARFFRSMSLLISAGLNIKDCIVNSAAMTVNPYIQKDLLKALPLVAEGMSLVQSFAACTSLTRTAREMLAVGEHSGNLEGSLKKVAEYHHEEAKHAVKVAITVTGVLITLAVAAIIGYVIISFYSKLYGGMMNQLGI